MVTRIERLSEFSTDAALDDAPLELLCEDHRGTYVLPYPCILSGSVWRNAATSDQIWRMSSDGACIGHGPQAIGMLEAWPDGNLVCFA